MDVLELFWRQFSKEFAYCGADDMAAAFEFFWEFGDCVVDKFDKFLLNIEAGLLSELRH